MNTSPCQRRFHTLDPISNSPPYQFCLLFFLNWYCFPFLDELEQQLHAANFRLVSARGVGMTGRDFLLPLVIHSNKWVSWLSAPCTVSLLVCGEAYLNATASPRREELQRTLLGQVIDHRFLEISPLVGKTSVCDSSIYMRVLVSV